MALLSNEDELITSWRDLQEESGREGWRTIPIGRGVHSKFLAGRQFPGGSEALIFGFDNFSSLIKMTLPEAKGFTVSEVHIGFSPSHRWFSLSKKQAANLDFFLMMTLDLMDLMQKIEAIESAKKFGLFIARIKSWQEFMNRSNDGILTHEEEIGLIGELELFSSLVKSGLDSFQVLSRWTGPLGKLHDFTTPVGGIEVKTTASKDKFLATIGSLEQLDNLDCGLLYLVGYQYEEQDAGKTLAERVFEVRAYFESNDSAKFIFDNLLLDLGYVEAQSYLYRKKYTLSEMKILEVTGNFPRLIKSNIPVEIISIKYQIDLNLITSDELKYSDLHIIFGVLNNGA